MEQTRKDTVIECCAQDTVLQPSTVTQVPQEDGLRHHQKWEESGMSKRKEHKPKSGRICTPTFVSGLKRSIKANPGTPMSILARKRGAHLPTPYTFQQDSVPAHKAKIVQSSLKKNVSNFWDFNTLPPNNLDLNHVTTTCREVGEG
ncbi:Transposable element tcb1 transposase, partial [Caligus rogercresseyi]